MRYVLATNKRRDIAMLFDTAKEPPQVLAISQQTTAVAQTAIAMNQEEKRRENENLG